MTRTALRVVDPHKTYGSVTALDRLSFTVQPGEIVGLLGPNGAGKTTTISMVLGVLQPTTGYVYIGDIDLAKKREEVLARTNFAAVYAALPGNLTVNENLKFFGWLYGIRSPSRRVAELLKEFDLVRLSHTKCGLLSSGEQTRAACQGAAQQTAAPAAGRTHRLAGPGRGTTHSREDHDAGPTGWLRHFMDLAQYERGGGDVRSSAFPIPRKGAVGGRPASPAVGARRDDSRRFIHSRSTQAPG